METKITSGSEFIWGCLATEGSPSTMRYTPITIAEIVNHPSHYNTGKFEVIDVIEDWNLGFNLGNCIKYISRAGKKDPSKTIEDLQKALWYINREIAFLSKNK